MAQCGTASVADTVWYSVAQCAKVVWNGVEQCGTAGVAETERTKRSRAIKADTERLRLLALLPLLDSWHF